MKKRSSKEQDAIEIVASYSEELNKGRRPCIDKYLENFTGDKDELFELLKTVELLHDFLKKPKEPSKEFIQRLSKKLRNLSKEEFKK